eukprot:3513172-Rhodomonas_salina.1
MPPIRQLSRTEPARVCTRFSLLYLAALWALLGLYPTALCWDTPCGTTAALHTPAVLSCSGTAWMPVKTDACATSVYVRAIHVKTD